MELDAVNGMNFMLQAHDDAICGFGSDLDAFRQARTLNRQRMIARHVEPGRQILEHALTRVAHRGQLAMHRQRRAHHLAAESLGDGLMPEADTEHRQPRFGRCCHEIETDTGLRWRARAWRQHDRFRLEPQHVVDGDLVVAMNLARRTELTQEVDEIVGETVVVIDEDQHE